jgi:hypothetical protein
LIVIVAGASALCKTSSRDGSGLSPAPLLPSTAAVRISTEAALSPTPFVGNSKGYFVLLAPPWCFISRPSMPRFSTRLHQCAPPQEMDRVDAYPLHVAAAKETLYSSGFPHFAPAARLKSRWLNSPSSSEPASLIFTPDGTMSPLGSFFRVLQGSSNKHSCSVCLLQV